MVLPSLLLILSATRLISLLPDHSSPAQTLAILFDPLDPPIASQSNTRDVRLAHASTACINGSSKLSLFLLIGSGLDQSKRARVYEHRHPDNPIDPGCAFREHKD